MNRRTETNKSEINTLPPWLIASELVFHSHIIVRTHVIWFQCVGSCRRTDKISRILKGSHEKHVYYHQVWIFLPVGENGLNEVFCKIYTIYLFYILPPSEKYISSINRKYTIITCVLTIIWLWKTNSEAINHGGRVLISLLLVSVRRFMSENRQNISNFEREPWETRILSPSVNFFARHLKNTYLQ